MNEYEWYVMYCSLKAHFTREKYDYFKYGMSGKTFTVEKYESRKDKYYFKKLAKRYAAERKQFTEIFYASNFVRNPDLWIGDMMDETCAVTATQSQHAIKSIEYSTVEDFKKILNKTDNWKQAFESRGQLPLCYRMMLSADVNVESLVVLNKVLDINRIISDNIDSSVPIWSQLKTRIYKYSPFVIIQDVDTLKRIKQGLRYSIITHTESISLINDS